MGFYSFPVAILGLEKHLWAQVPYGERRLYAITTICFLFFLILSAISGGTLFYLITSSILTSIPMGLVLSLVVGTIVRFSLIILRRSIFDFGQDEQLLKETVYDNGHQKDKHAEATVDSSTAHSFYIKLKQKSQFLLAGFNGKRLLLLKASNSFFALVIRVSILSVVGLLVLFPLVCFIQFQNIDEVNQKQRAFYINRFEKEDRATSYKNLRFLELKIAKTELEIKQQQNLNKEKLVQLNDLKLYLVALQKKNEEKFDLNLRRYRDDINRRYFIIHSFLAAERLPIFPIIAFLIFSVLFLPHYILYRLKSDKQFVYSELSTQYYKKRIDEEYFDNQQYILNHLQEKYGFRPKTGFEKLVWSNPPYCTEKTKHFGARKKMNKDEFLTFLNKKTKKIES